MPASARSLRITESYRTRMIGLRNRAKAEAKRTWAKVDPDRLDATFNPGMLVLMTAQLQREAARLSAGYLAAYVSSEKGERVPPPMAVGLDVGKVWTGSSLTKAFRGAVIGTKIQIGDGKEPVEAYKEGGQALVRTAGLAVDDVCRESLRVAMDQSPDVNGYVRAVKGTCEACLGAADGAKENPGEPLDTHPNCQCVSEPQVALKNPRELTPDDYRFSDEVQSRLVDYQWESEQLNGALRTGSEMRTFEQRILDNLDGAFGQTKPLGESTQSYRATAGGLDDIAGLKDAKVGTSFVDEGFGSTTPTRSWAESIGREGAGGGRTTGDYTLWELEIDGRTKMLDLDKAIDKARQAIEFEDEDEILLQRGVRYLIKSITKKGKVTHVVAKVVPK